MARGEQLRADTCSHKRPRTDKRMRYCKKCKVTFEGDTCPLKHANFMCEYSRMYPMH